MTFAISKDAKVRLLRVVSCGYTLARVSTYMGGARKTSTRAVTWSKAKKLPGN